MTKEQEEAIEMLEDIKNNTWTTKYIMSSDSKKAETVLNMLKEKDKYIKDANDITTEMSNDIKKLTSEIEKKDKIIDLMAEEIYEHRYQNNLNFFKDAKKARGITTSIKDIKQYFKEIAERKSKE